MKTSFLTILAALAVTGSPAQADDLFYADGKQNVLRTLNHNKKTLLNVQLGEWHPEGVEIYHTSGMTLVSVKQLPGLWQKALWQRMAGKLAPPGAGAAVKEQITAGLATALDIAPRALAIKVKRTDGTDFTGWVIAGKDKQLLLATTTAAGWLAENKLTTGAAVRTELACSFSRTAWNEERKRVQTAAGAEAATAKLEGPKAEEFVKKAVGDWEQGHPKPAREDGEAAVKLPDGAKQ